MSDVKQINNVLALIEKNTIVVRDDLCTKKVCQRTKILEVEALREMTYESLNILYVIPNDNDVININKQIEDGATLIEDEQEGVGNGIGEAIIEKKLTQFMYQAHGACLSPQLSNTYKHDGDNHNQ